MKKVYFLIIFCTFFFQTSSQNSLTGTVLDAKTGEALIGSNVMLVNPNIKTENHSHNISKDLHININYKSQLYFTDDIIGNSALFDLIEVSFSDDFFTDFSSFGY